MHIMLAKICVSIVVILVIGAYLSRAPIQGNTVHQYVSENVIKIFGDFGPIFWKKPWAIVQ